MGGVESEVVLCEPLSLQVLPGVVHVWHHVSQTASTYVLKNTP